MHECVLVYSPNLKFLDLLLTNNRHCVSLWISNICEVVKNFLGQCYLACL